MDKKKVFETYFSFCREHGYLELLFNSLEFSEADGSGGKEIEKSGLDVLDAVHCLVDENRTFLLLEEIERSVRSGEKVLEAGIGTGILSWAAGALGATATGLELNPDVLMLAKKILRHIRYCNHNEPAEVEFVLADATEYVPDSDLDVIISENIYTGLFFEKQVQIMNHLIKYLRPGGKVIPLGLESGIALANLQMPIAPAGGSLFVIGELSPKASYKLLSSSAIYSSVNFEKQNETSIDARVVVDINRSGSANSVLIWSEVLMYDRRRIGRSDTKFLNNDILIVLPKSFTVTKGEKIELSIQYCCGCPPESAIIFRN